MNKFLRVFATAGSLILSTTIFAADPLVDVNWVKTNSCSEGVRVLDIRNGIDGGSRTDYLKGHIPCAIYTNYLEDGWRATVNNVGGVLPPVADVEKLIGGLGIDNDTHVVIYHHGTKAADFASATRIYWTFNMLGHENVSILNGGYRAYTADKENKIEKGNNKAEGKVFEANLQTDMLATAADVKSVIENGGAQLVDLRGHDQYLGVNRYSRAKRSGTLPGALNLPGTWMTINDGGTLRDTETLKKLYSAAEVDTQEALINFCNSGHWASLGWFVSSQILGNKKARLYDGSMLEWSAIEGAPVERAIQF